MKRIICIISLVLLLSGCKDDALDNAMLLREQMQTGEGCSFDAKITADYVDEIYEFQMNCESNAVGDVAFSVTAPETISGITGIVSDEGGKLTFDDQALMFELMADGQITPVSAPWILVKTLRGGYLKACTYIDDGMMLVVNDSYEDDALQLDIWLNEECIPTEAEILWDGRRILSLQISNFVFL